MMKKVENDVEKALFNFIWMTAWREKGYEFEFATDVLGRYVVITPQGEYVGTAEFKPYSPSGSALDEVAPFREHPIVARDPSSVAEIDKIALLKEFRGTYLSELLSIAVQFAKHNGYHYFLSLLEPVFYRALRITYRVPMEKVGGPIFYKGDHVIPVIFDMKAIYEHADRYDWLSMSPVGSVEWQTARESLHTY